MLTTGVLLLTWGCASPPEGSESEPKVVPDADTDTDTDTDTGASWDGPDVSLESTDGGWQLLVQGAPFVVRGAGGAQHLERLKSVGGNSLRIWGVDEDTEALLDEAVAADLRVMVGLWKSPADELDYTDAAAVATQHEALLASVEALKDHPAVLLWGINTYGALDSLPIPARGCELGWAMDGHGVWAQRPLGDI